MLLIVLCAGYAWAEDNVPADDVIRDIIETMVELDQDADIEQIEENLSELIQQPIELNQATAADLERLYFLTDEQIDAILLYVHLHPMDNLYELQLVPRLKDYDIRRMLPFVRVEHTESRDDRTAADLFRYARHEVDMRLDVRNIEAYEGDPVYASLRYKMNASNKVMMGLTLKRDAGEQYNAKSRYGAYAELRDIGVLKTLVAGDYRATFGLGLVMNSALPIGKSGYAAQLGLKQQGLRHYSGCSQDYMRGAGATVKLGRFDVSTFYSIRMPDTIYRQTAGANVTYRHKRLRVGATAVEYWTSDSLPYRANYYNGNYFRGKRQFSASLSAQYYYRGLTLMGEVATAENAQWGAAAIVGARYVPIEDVSLLAVGRYYSPHYDAIGASTFGETSRPNDEYGGYIGAEINRLKRWRFSIYSDFFGFSGPKYMIRQASWGYDLYGQAIFVINSRHDMLWRARIKRKGDVDTYRLRYALSNTWGYLTLRSQLDASLVREETKPLAYGAMLSEQLEYRPSNIPIAAQARIEAFYVPTWSGRIYSYENDVLYAFSIPSVYGIGARYYLNLRYRISDHYSLYIKASDTWYTKKWAERQHMTSCHKTDIHLMMRFTI